MTTPIIVLAILLSPWLAMGLLRRDWYAGGLAGLVLAFAFFALGHFVQTEAMAQMLPAWVPLRTVVIWSTGLLELAIVVGLILPKWRRRAGQVAIAVLVVFFSANIYAAFARTGMGGHQWGPAYLLIRGPLQILLIFWAWRFAAAYPRRNARVDK